MAECSIRRRDKPGPNLEVDTPNMLAAVVWLALFETGARTRRCLGIDLVGSPALTTDFVKYLGDKPRGFTVHPGWDQHRPVSSDRGTNRQLMGGFGNLNIPV